MSNVGLSNLVKYKLYINTAASFHQELSVGKYLSLCLLDRVEALNHIDGLEEGSTYVQDYIRDRITIGAQVYSGATLILYSWSKHFKWCCKIPQIQQLHIACSKTGTQLETGHSVHFDGGSDVLSIDDDNTLDFGTGDWTVSVGLIKQSFLIIRYGQSM